MNAVRPGELAGTGTLIRHVVRRDRVRLIVWIAVTVIMPWSTYGRYAGLYPTAESRRQLAETAGAAQSFNLLLGPAFDVSNAGGFVAWRVGLWVAMFLAIFAVLTVVRHTRAEEDAGRAELVRSGVVGRSAPLAAALTVTLLTVVTAGLVTALLLVAAGAAPAGAWAFGAGLTLTGAVFAGVAAVTAQIAAYSRSASGMALGALGLAFLLRGWGDGSGHAWLSWLSPLGWNSQLRAFAGNRWGVLALPMVAWIALVAVAAVLLHRRDLGAGLVAQRDGRATAPASLRGPLGLVWRLQRGSWIGWAVGFGLSGLVLGSLTGAINGLVGDNDAGRQIVERMGGAGQLTVGYVALLMPLFGAVAVLYGVGSVSHARSEETEDRLEPLLATPVSRLRWLGADLVLALGGAAMLVVVGGLGVAATALPAVRSGAFGLGDVLGGAVLQIPAVWFLVALAAALLGLVPRLTGLGWAAAGVVLAITWLGPALGLSAALLKLSPFEHLPKVPGETVTVTPLLALTALAALLLAAAAYGFRRRDLGV